MDKARKSHIAKCVVKAVVFLLVFSTLLCGVNRVMTVDTSNYEYKLMTSIYDEADNSLDALYIGSSNTFVFWNSLAAFNEYGMAVLPYSSNRQPLLAARFLIEEARKTQPDALYIVNVNSLIEGPSSDLALHKLLDYMPLTAEKLRLTDYLTTHAELSVEDKIEYYFPLMRYHSRWDELEEGNFDDYSVDRKNSSVLPYYLDRTEDITSVYKTSDETMEVVDAVVDNVNDMLDYCDEENVKVIFCIVPQAREKMETVLKYNTVEKIITDRGYTVLDFLNNIEPMGIDKNTDFYNNHHTNIHGSLKFTHYLADYLNENYEFTDKRNDPTFESWSMAYNDYEKTLDDYVLDFELMADTRNFDLSAVTGLSAKKQDDGNLVSWTGVDDADGYAIYCKTDGKWSCIGETAETQFLHEGSNSGVYTVVTYTGEGESKLYGDFSYKGVSAK